MDKDTFINYETLSEAEKLDKDYMKKRVDSIISELVKENRDRYKLFNYYYGYRTNEDYRIMEENYGVGTPTKIKSIPLIKKHVDRIVSEYLMNIESCKPRVTCKDKRSLKKMEKEKEDHIKKNELNELDNRFHNNFDHFFKDPENNKEGLYKTLHEDLKKYREVLGKEFISEIEISAQNILNNLRLNSKKNLDLKLRSLFTNLLVSGSSYYRTYYEHEGQTPILEVIHPVNVFHPNISNNGDLTDISRCVWAEHLSKVDILNRYGHMMSNDDIEKVKNLEDYRDIDIDYYGAFPRYAERLLYYDDFAENEGSQDGSDYDSIDDLFPVYHTEWISDNKETKNGGKIFRQDLYQGIRICGDIHVNLTKVKSPRRSVEDPYKTSTSLSGIIANQYNGKMYSLVKAGIHLQDKYDLLHFIEENTFALSGVKGQIVDLSLIPADLGSTFEERLASYLGYRKNGTIIINTAEEGSKNALNTIFNGYDDSVPVNSINALQAAKDSVESQMSSISGAYREMLGGIQQKDAVNNVNVGIKQSYIILQQHFSLMANVVNHMYTDYLNTAKMSLKGGFVGSYIIGDNALKVFTLLPNTMSLSDIDVHIGDNQTMIESKETIKQMALEMIKSGSTDIELIIDMVGSDSITDLKRLVSESSKKKEEEHGTKQQLEQKMQELASQNEQLTKELEEVKKKDMEMESAKFKLEKDKFMEEFKFKREELNAKRSEAEKKSVNDDEKVKIELAQLADDSPYNDKVNFNK